MEEKLKQQSHLNPDCLKIVFFGPESTGKSTLVKALAKHYNTNYVEEFARSYAENKLDQGKTLSKLDVLPIAQGQMQLENLELKNSNNLLICDTDLLETKVYSEFYYDGFCPELLTKYALKNTYDLYFLTYIDTPWEADSIRDQPNQRMQLFNAFEQALLSANKPFVTLKGTLEERLDICKLYIDKLLNKTH